MAITIPEIQMYNLIRGLLILARTEYEKWNTTDGTEAVTDNTKILLYQMFNGLTLEKSNYYDQVISLITRKDSDPRALAVRYYFDAKRAKVPTIHITLPSEGNGPTDGIGVSPENAEIGSWVDEGSLGVGSDLRRESVGRSFSTQIQVIITSDNHQEVTLIYHMMKSLLISAFDSISLTGLQNPKVSGRELQINESVANTLFMRSIVIDSHYETRMPKCDIEDDIYTVLRNLDQDPYTDGTTNFDHPSPIEG